MHTTQATPVGTNGRFKDPWPCQVPASIAFTRDASHGDRHYLEWEATAFEGTLLRGVTILTKNDDGKVVHAAIHHRPLDGVRKFSAELGRCLQGKVDASHFYGAA